MRIRLRYITRLASIASYFTLASVIPRNVYPVPFLICDSCPLSFGVCPIGMIQKLLALGFAPCFFVGSLILYAVIIGRASCGLLCPIGALQDAISWISRQVGMRRVRLPESKMKIIIPLSLVLASASGVIVFCKICISGLLFAGIPWRILWWDLRVTSLFILHIIVFIAVIILVILAGRVWCRYLCPFMLLGLLNKRKMLVKITLDEEKCSRCNLCLKECPMGISSVNDISSSMDCIFCGLCVEKCPRRALKFELY